MAAAVAIAWCFPICPAASTVDEPLRHAMEAAGEWAQAVSLPRPRLLEALRDDSRVKAALADGAVLAVVPLVFNSGKGAAAPAPRRASRVHCGSSDRRCLHAGPGFEEGTPVAPAVAPAPVAARKCPPNRYFLQALTSRISIATRSGRCWPAGRCWPRPSAISRTMFAVFLRTSVSSSAVPSSMSSPCEPRS